MATDNSLYIFCYVKKKGGTHLTVSPANNQVESCDFGIPAKDFILQVNGIEVRGRKLKELKEVFNGLPLGEPVFITLLRQNGNKAFLKPKYPILDVKFGIRGLCRVCPQGNQVQDYKTTDHWKQHIRYFLLRII